MIYLDNGATSFVKPPRVYAAVQTAIRTCANVGRGGYPAAMQAAQTVLACRQQAARLFFCKPEQVVFTHNCTHGLNMAINTLVRPGAQVAVSGFEHNAVMRPLYARGAKLKICGRKLFDPDDTLSHWEDALKQGVDCAVFTHCSNVFGYILPIEEMAQLCKQYGVPYIIDAAQSAGVLPVTLGDADFVAMPGHKGLLGPQGTGILLCNRIPAPLLSGGTGTDSIAKTMPDFLPEAGEAGTLNVPGIAGLRWGLDYILQRKTDTILYTEQKQVRLCAHGLQKLGYRVFHGEHQTGTLSFVPPGDCEEFAGKLARKGIAVRAGLHCAPLAHESAGTLDSGTVRVSFGHDATSTQTRALLTACRTLS